MEKENQKKGFWRGFTWKRFGKYFLFAFILFGIELLWRAYFESDDFSAYLTYKRIIGLFMRTIFFSFFFALWFEPGEIFKRRPKKKS